jgi:predicted AlkP superfamily phosphohydrolase/phosphomutase
MLSGMGVPDLRGGFGTPTFYSTKECAPRESEQVVRLAADGQTRIATHVIGPRHPRTKASSQCEITLELDTAQKRLFVRSAGRPKDLEVREGQWSGWLRLNFKLGPLQSVRGIVRFLLVRLEPALELYASPVNFDPDAPLFPISSPDGYAGDLAAELGKFYTTGLVEDHNGLVNERFGEEAFLAQSDDAWREREAMMTHELGRFRAGLFYCLFDTPDRVQHMLWRFREPEHPANRGRTTPAEFLRAIEEHYRRGDRVVGRALEAVDDRTLLIVLSDHGFSSFQRGFHLNTWLFERGLLALRAGLAPGAAAGDLLRGVDWERTRAYAIGLTGLYLNLQGREARGAVRPDEAEELAAAIARELTGLEDPERGVVAVRSALRREQVYAGPCAHESPDVIVNYAPGYPVSRSTSLGGVAGVPVFEDNTRKWAGDHIIDPALVPGVLLMNRAFREEGARLVDLAPTILAALGQSVAPGLEGKSLIDQAGPGRPDGPAEIDEAERVVRERLSGLGYV